jgi:non-ribosomal peptide synthetase component F
VRPQRTPGEVPFVRSLFVLHRPLRAQRCGATSFERLDLGAEVPGSDLALLVEIEGDRLSGTWSYRRELFEDATIAALARDFERLLAGAERSPDETLGSLVTGDG